LIDHYDAGLSWVLRHQRATMVVAVSTLAITGLLYMVIPKGFFPQQDTGLIQAISQGPQTVSFAAMGREQTRLAGVLLGDEDVVAVSSFIGVDGTNATLNTGRMQIALKPVAERQDDVNAIMARLSDRVRGVGDMQLFMQPVQELTVDDQISRTQYQMTLSSPDLAELQDWTPDFVRALQQAPALADVTHDMQNAGLQTTLVVDRDKAARLGVTQQSIDDALYDAFGQRLLSTIFTQSAQYRVGLEVGQSYQDSAHALDSIYVAPEQGAPVPITSLAALAEAPSMLSLQRQGQFPAVTVSFNLAQGVALSD